MVVCRVSPMLSKVGIFIYIEDGLIIVRALCQKLRNVICVLN